MRSVKHVVGHYEPLSGGESSSKTSERRIVLEKPELLFRGVLEMCKWNDPDLLTAVRSLEKSCQLYGFSMASLLTMARDDNTAPLVLLMQTKNPRILQILHRNLANGWPVENQVKRTDDSLLMRSNSSGGFWGFQVFGKGCVYVGDICNGMRSGKGRVQMAHDWHYEGDFLDNKKHGFGYQYIGGREPTQQKGIFVDNIYVGDPLVAPRPPESSWYRRLRDFF